MPAALLAVLLSTSMIGAPAAVALAGHAGASPPVDRRIQPIFVCWASDMEFPVDCDDDD